MVTVEVGLDAAALAGVLRLAAGQVDGGGAGLGQGALGVGQKVPERERIPVSNRVDGFAELCLLGLSAGLVGGR